MPYHAVPIHPDVRLVCELTEGHVLHKTTAQPPGIKLDPVPQRHLPPPPGSRIS